MGDVDAEKFMSLISKEPFDYTQWQKVPFGVTKPLNW